MKVKLRYAPMAFAAMVACMSAHAGYQTPDGNFSLSGFGTVGAVATSTNDVLFRYPGQAGGANKNFSLNPDSKAAVQGTYKFSPTVSATTQVLSKFDPEGQFTPNIEWAFAKWQASPSLSIRAGKIGAPFFMISDFRDVGFANTAVRPNLDVYGQVSFSAFEGADVSYQAALGSATVTSTLWAGNLNNKYSSALRGFGEPALPVDLDLKRTFGLNLVAEMDNGLTLRAGHTQGKLSSRSPSALSVVQGATAVAGFANKNLPPPLSNPLGGLAASLNAGLSDLTQAMTVNNTDASFTGLGLSYDQDNWVFSGEFTKRKVKNGYIADSKGWYALAGYRFGSWLPYVSTSRLTTRSNTSVADSTLNGYGGAYATLNAAASLDPYLPSGTRAQLMRGAAGALYGSQAVLNTQKQTENTLSAGVRWDVKSGLALKAQIDHVHIPANSIGLFLMADPALAASQGDTFVKNPNKQINVISVSLDFVF